MTISRKVLPLLFIFLAIPSSLLEAGTPFAGDFTLKATLSKEAIAFATTIAFSFSEEAFELTSTWKATEAGYSSLKFTGEGEFPGDVKGRLEGLFGKDGLSSIKLKGVDLPLRKALMDLEAHFKLEGAPTLYQVTVGLDELTVARLPASADLAFREEYLRARLTLDREDETFSVQGVFKKGTLDEAKTTLDHEAKGWSIKEVVTFKPGFSRLRPEKGTLTVKRDLLDNLSLNVVCDHSFPGRGIALSKITSTLKLKAGTFEMTWKGTFRPSGGIFSLGGYTLSLAEKPACNNLSLNTALKIDEGGFHSLSVQLSYDL